MVLPTNWKARSRRRKPVNRKTGVGRKSKEALDEHGRRAHVDNIQSKHLDMFARMIVHGTITFGYFGEPIGGELTKLGRPRRRYIIDEIESEYVFQIFRWFVEDGMSIAEIIQMLNDDPDAPLPPRAEQEWTRVAVIHLLKNTRYIGVFKYGKQESVDQPDAGYVLRRDRGEASGVPRSFWPSSTELVVCSELSRSRNQGIGSFFNPTRPLPLLENFFYR